MGKVASLVTDASNTFLRFLPIIFEYTSRPSHERCRNWFPVSRFQGLETITAAFRTQSLPSSPRYYVVDAHIRFKRFIIYLKAILSVVRTFVKIFAPRE